MCKNYILLSNRDTYSFLTDSKCSVEGSKHLFMSCRNKMHWLWIILLVSGLSAANDMLFDYGDVAGDALLIISDLNDGSSPAAYFSTPFVFHGASQVLSHVSVTHAWLQNYFIVICCRLSFSSVPKKISVTGFFRLVWNRFSMMMRRPLSMHHVIPGRGRLRSAISERPSDRDPSSFWELYPIWVPLG